MHYVLVLEFGKPKFENEVNNKIREGYIPHGGLAVMDDCFAQAMVKMESTPDNDDALYQ